MEQKSLLVDGKIPAKTECPFRSECSFAKNETCSHRGADHHCAYSCGAARFFDIFRDEKKS